MSWNHSPRRIVLLDPLGDVLFSGESISGETDSRSDECVRASDSAAAVASSEADSPDSSEAPTERCPDTMRSAGSGVYRAVDRRAASAVEVVETVVEPLRRRRVG